MYKRQTQYGPGQHLPATDVQITASWGDPVSLGSPVAEKVTELPEIVPADENAGTAQSPPDGSEYELIRPTPGREATEKGLLFAPFQTFWDAAITTPVNASVLAGVESGTQIGVTYTNASDRPYSGVVPTHIEIDGTDYPVSGGWINGNPPRQINFSITNSQFNTSKLLKVVKLKYSGQADVELFNQEAQAAVPARAAGFWRIVLAAYVKIASNAKTPQRVSVLPAEVLNGDRVYNQAAYEKDSGFDMAPVSFAETSLAGFGVGNRGVWKSSVEGYGLGFERGMPDGALLISNSKIYVRDTATVLKTSTHFGIGSREFPLALNAAAPEPVNTTPGEVDAKFFDVGGGGLPAGPWKNCYFKLPGGVKIPAIITIPEGLFEGVDGVWQEADFQSQDAHPERDFKIKAEVQIPGGKESVNLSFLAAGNDFETKDNPFGTSEAGSRVIKVRYGNTPADSGEYRRYLVDVPLAIARGTNLPDLLEFGTKNWTLNYFETDADKAVYKTPVVDAADRLSAGVL